MRRGRRPPRQHRPGLWSGRYRYGRGVRLRRRRKGPRPARRGRPRPPRRRWPRYQWPRYQWPRYRSHGGHRRGWG
ncbi:hypothetical protein E1293_42270, partial [Actinomadura darangshiensis]